MNAGAEKFRHKTKMLSIVIETWVDELGQKLGTMVVRSHLVITDDNRWRTSNSRRLCSRFKRVARPVRILMVHRDMYVVTRSSVNDLAA
jgi:hypothetical protein